MPETIVPDPLLVERVRMIRNTNAAHLLGEAAILTGDPASVLANNAFGLMFALQAGRGQGPVEAARPLGDESNPPKPYIPVAAN